VIDAGDNASCQAAISAAPPGRSTATSSHVFRARDSIVIKDGFEVLAGVTFSVELEPTAGSSVGLP
jgi:hypothetical protein